VSDFCLTLNEQFFRYIMGRTSYIDGMMTMSALYHTNMICWIFIVLVHCNNCPWVDVSLH